MKGPTLAKLPKINAKINFTKLSVNNLEYLFLIIDIKFVFQKNFFFSIELIMVKNIL